MTKRTHKQWFIKYRDVKSGMYCKAYYYDLKNYNEAKLKMEINYEDYEIIEIGFKEVLI